MFTDILNTFATGKTSLIAVYLQFALVFTKARIAPPENFSILRWEVQAALLAIHLKSDIKKNDNERYRRVCVEDQHCCPPAIKLDKQTSRVFSNRQDQHIEIVKIIKIWCKKFGRVNSQPF